MTAKSGCRNSSALNSLPSTSPAAFSFRGRPPPPAEGSFAQDRPPRWLLVLSFNRILLMGRGKWPTTACCASAWMKS